MVEWNRMHLEKKFFSSENSSHPRRHLLESYIEH